MTPNDSRPELATAAREPTEMEEVPEPVTTGTLFIMLLFLMALAALWGIMYFTLIGR